MAGRKQNPTASFLFSKRLTRPEQALESPCFLCDDPKNTHPLEIAVVFRDFDRKSRIARYNARLSRPGQGAAVGLSVVLRRNRSQHSRGVPGKCSGEILGSITRLV
jgi:hypothetical protein